MEARSGSYSINGLNLNVQVAGEGPPVLLLHGFPDSLKLWHHQVPALVAAGFQVIAYDQRGFGDSDAPVGTEHYALDHIVADAIGILDALNIREKVRLVGHDFGAVVGWMLAAHHPERVERYVAVSVGHPTAYARAGLAQKLRGWYTVAFQVPGLAERIYPWRDWAVLRRMFAGEPDLEYWLADLRRPGRLTAGLNWYRANFGTLLRRRIPNVRVPVLGIWSTRDVALVEGQMTDSSGYVDGPWRYERIEGVGHWIPTNAP